MPDYHGVQMDYNMITKQRLTIAPYGILEGGRFLIIAPYQLLEGSEFLMQISDYGTLLVIGG